MGCLNSFARLCSVNFANMLCKHVENVLFLALTFVIFHLISLQSFHDSSLCFINSFILVDRLDRKRTILQKWWSLFTRWPYSFIHWWRNFWSFIASLLLTYEGSGFLSIPSKSAWYVLWVWFCPWNQQKHINSSTVLECRRLGGCCVFHILWFVLMAVNSSNRLAVPKIVSDFMSLSFNPSSPSKRKVF